VTLVPDSEVRIILRSHVSNFGIERTSASLLFQHGFGSEACMTNRGINDADFSTATLVDLRLRLSQDRQVRFEEIVRQAVRRFTNCFP
jgi:hypothetical protein